MVVDNDDNCDDCDSSSQLCPTACMRRGMGTVLPGKQLLTGFAATNTPSCPFGKVSCFTDRHNPRFRWQCTPRRRDDFDLTSPVRRNLTIGATLAMMDINAYRHVHQMELV